MIGGNWRYENDNGTSSAYRSLHINSARKLMSYKAFPMPEDYPDYPSHWQVAKYFDDYAERFGLVEKITFNTEVVAAEPEEDGWNVTVEGRQTARAGPSVTGRCWSPTAITGSRAGPNRRFPAPTQFEGEQMHVHHYREPDVLEGKRVLVLGNRQLGRRRRGRVLANRREDLPVDAPRRLRPAQVPRRHADRRSRPADRELAADLGAALLLQQAAEDRDRRDDRLRPAQARPQAARGPPDRLLGAAAAARPRRHHGQAQHRPLRRRPHGALRRWQRGGDRPGRLLHRLQDRVPFPRREGLCRP